MIQPMEAAMATTGMALSRKYLSGMASLVVPMIQAAGARALESGHARV